MSDVIISRSQGEATVRREVCKATGPLGRGAMLARGFKLSDFWAEWSVGCDEFRVPQELLHFLLDGEICRLIILSGDDEAVPS